MDADGWHAGQGSVISPLLANIYLHPLDVLMAERGYRMVRYADDPGSNPGRAPDVSGAGPVILTRSRGKAHAALALVSKWVAANGLTLHPSKTHVGNCRVPGQGFEFLGYRFEAGKRSVRKKSLDRIKDTIRDKTKRTIGQSLAFVIADLNRPLRGWFGYFKHARRKTFDDLDQFIRRRLRALLRKQAKRPGMG